MSAKMALLKATVEAWAINAKREKEANYSQSGELCHEWRGQEIAFKRVQDLLTKAGIV